MENEEVHYKFVLGGAQKKSLVKTLHLQLPKPSGPTALGVGSDRTRKKEQQALQKFENSTHGKNGSSHSTYLLKGGIKGISREIVKK